MKNILVIITSICTQSIIAQFAPPAGESGTTALHKDSSAFIAWATQVYAFERGLEDITNPDGPLVSFGELEAALNEAEGNSVDVVSLGDLGKITLGFEYSIRNGSGPDFAVFENSFSDTYLEFAHVEVSSDGERFVRIPSISNIGTEEQIETYETCDPRLVHNLAGKYRQGYGTPFDLEDIIDSVDIDLNDIKFVRIIDAVGSVDPLYGTVDSEGTVINDPFKTDFESGGFDLDAVGVIHNNDPTVGIFETIELNVECYPNPSQGMFQFNTEIEFVSIYNLTGQLILRESRTEKIKFPTSLENGMYVVHFQLKDGNSGTVKLQLLR